MSVPFHALGKEAISRPFQVGLQSKVETESQLVIDIPWEDDTGSGSKKRALTTYDPC